MNIIKWTSFSLAKVVKKSLTKLSGNLFFFLIVDILFVNSALAKFSVLMLHLNAQTKHANKKSNKVTLEDFWKIIKSLLWLLTVVLANLVPLQLNQKTISIVLATMINQLNTFANFVLAQFVSNVFSMNITVTNLSKLKRWHQVWNKTSWICKRWSSIPKDWMMKTANCLNKSKKNSKDWSFNRWKTLTKDSLICKKNLRIKNKKSKMNLKSDSKKRSKNSWQSIPWSLLILMKSVTLKKFLINSSTSLIATLMLKFSRELMMWRLLCTSLSLIWISSPKTWFHKKVKSSFTQVSNRLLWMSRRL